MKKIIAMFAITMMLVLSAFGQQAATVAPAQTPAPAKTGKTATVKPAVATSVSSETPVATSVATVAPASQAKPATANAKPVAVSPAKVASEIDVDIAQIAPTPAAQATVTPAAQLAPTPTLNIASQSPSPAASTLTSQQAPATGQASSPAAAPQPRVASTITGQQSGVATTAPTARAADYIEEKGFKGKVFEVKYRTPDSLASALSALGSGFKGATIRANDEFKTITVRDFPENIATIEEAIKRLDTPQPVRPDLEFRIQVLIASNAPSQGEEYPADLNEVVKQLQSTFKYKNYALMFTSTHRTKESGNGVYNNGVAESKLFNVAIPAGNQIFYDYGIMQISLDNSTSAGTTVQIGAFNFGLRIPLVLGGATDPKIQYQNVGFRSPVSLREGEKVVVGTTTMGDKGLIVVLTAKVTK